MLLSAGKELLSDAVLLHEAGLNAEQCVVNVMPMTNPNTFTSPEPAALQALEAASPTLLLSSQVSQPGMPCPWLAASSTVTNLLLCFCTMLKPLLSAVHGSYFTHGAHATPFLFVRLVIWNVRLPCIDDSC